MGTGFRLFGLVLVALVGMLSSSSITAQETVCTSSSLPSGLQTALRLDPSLAPLLDPDGNGIACDHDDPFTLVPSEPSEPVVSLTSGSFDGMLGSSEAGFAAVYGEPIETIEAGITTHTYASPSPTVQTLFVVYSADHRAISISIAATGSWDTSQAVEIMQPFLPADVTELPQPQPTGDGLSYLLAFHSTLYEAPEIADYMEGGAMSGEAGDFHVILHTTDGSSISEIVFRFGDGSDPFNPTPTAAAQSTTQASSGIFGNTRTTFEATYGAALSQVPPGEVPEGNEAFYYAPPSTASAFLVYYYEGVIDWISISTETPWTLDESITVLEPFLPADVTELPPLEPIDDITYLLSLHSTEFVTPDNEAWLREVYFGEPGDFYVRLHTEDGTNVDEIELGIGNLGLAIEEDASQVDSPVVHTTDSSSTGLTAEADAFLLATRAEVDMRMSEIQLFESIITAGTFSEAETDLFVEIIQTWTNMDSSLTPAPEGFSDMALQVQDIREEFGFLGLELTQFLTDPDNTTSADGGLLERIHMSLADLDAQLTALGY